MAAAVCLLRGKAALKSFLAEAGALDVSTLPYNEECIAFLRRERARGRKIILASASDQRLADAIAKHLGLFDEVYGTGADRNLGGAAKAALLCAKYGERGFDYIADRKVDMAVWRRARKALTVNAFVPAHAPNNRVNATLVTREQIETFVAALDEVLSRGVTGIIIDYAKNFLRKGLG
ncbi:MAG: haloacid dehalogenase-like hydrolase [Actinomycetota bacterium]